MTRATRLLTEEEVAAMLAMTPNALRVARQREQGPPFVKLGSRVRYVPADVVAYLREQRAATSSTRRRK